MRGKRGWFALGLAAAFVAAAPSGWAAPSRAVDIGLDPGLELLGVVELMGGRAANDKAVATLRSEEMRLTTERFSLWRAGAVRAWAAGSGATCDFLQRTDALVRLDLTELPEFAARSSIPSKAVECLGGPQAVEDWLDGLRAFSAESGFLEYFAAKKARWEPGVERFRSEAASMDFIGKIERYTGLPFLGTYAMPISSHYHPGAQVNSVIVNDDGTTRIVSIVGPRDGEGRAEIRMDEMLPVAWHELAHGILDRISDLYRDGVLRRASVQKSLPWDCYGGWEQCFKENMVRAVMIRLVARERGPRFGERTLLEEGPKKYPYLAAVVERLEEYEADRARYPTIAHFYPRLIDVFPAGPAPRPAPPRTKAPADPGPDWVAGAAVPFATAGQREKALALLDSLLDGRPDPDADLRLRRCALRVHQNLYDGALEDAAAALRARPGSAAAHYLSAVALQAKGLDREAVAALNGAARSCSAPGADAGLCRNVEARLGVSRAGRAGARMAPWAAVAFDADPRVELLGVVQMLADPGAFRVQFASAPPAYAEYGLKAWKAFAPFSGHPAVAGVKRLRKEGRLLEMVSGLLALSAPPELAPLPYANEGETSVPDAKFLEELRDFSLRSGFMAFYGNNAGLYGLLRERAEAEARRGLRPEAVAAYLRQDQLGRHRFIGTPLLPRDMAANARFADAGGWRNLRVRPADYGGKSLFDLDDFGASPAHEVGHGFLDPLAAEHRQELDAYAGLMVPGCTDSWQGCVLEHVDLAVTLRVLAVERGEAAYASALAEFKKKGYPYLEPLCLRLKEWETSSGGAFERFYPRLVAVFREALLKDASLQARETLLRRARQSESITEPRLELAAALIGLAEREEPSGPFSAFSSHTAVGLVRELLRRDEGRALPAQLMLYVSSPPAMVPIDLIPEKDAARAGGRRKLDDFYAAVRDFAVRSNFSGYYLSAADEYAGLARRHAERLKTAAPAEGRLAVSTLLPARYRARLTRIKSDSSSPEVWTLMSAGQLGEGGGPYAPVEMRVTTDPRVELLSALLLLGRPPGTGTGTESKSPYRLDAERWFAAFSTHPAVARTAALLQRDPELNLPAQLVLRLSAPPDLFAPEPIPGGYIDAAGGEEEVGRFIEALGDFAKSSRFMAFYEAHRADYAAFAAAAGKEALAAISPQAVQSYLGAFLGDRYTFLLAPLLPEKHAAALTLRQADRVEEVRLRPARYSREGGHRFLFDQFDATAAHELVHTVTNPLVSDLAARAPAGCRDREDGGARPGCVQEHLVYAVTLRIAARQLGERAYRRKLAEYKERDLPYLEALCERLKEYESARGRYETFKDFYPRLEAVFAKALPQGALPEPSPGDSETRHLKDQGVKDFMEGRYSDAAGRFTDALKLSPRDPEIFLNLGVVYDKLGQKDEALESYSRSIELSVSGSARARGVKVSAYSSRANLLFSLGRASEARRDLQRALEAAPSDWDGRRDLERRLAR